jgi:hypothetical protein
VHEKLREQHGLEIKYSTLTRLMRDPDGTTTPGQGRTHSRPGLRA